MSRENQRLREALARAEDEVAGLTSSVEVLRADAVRKREEGNRLVESWGNAQSELAVLRKRVAEFQKFEDDVRDALSWQDPDMRTASLGAVVTRTQEHRDDNIKLRNQYAALVRDKRISDDKATRFETLADEVYEQLRLTRRELEQTRIVGGKLEDALRELFHWVADVPGTACAARIDIDRALKALEYAEALRAGYPESRKS